MDFAPYYALSPSNSKLLKAVNVTNEDWHQHASLEEKEMRSLRLIRTALEVGELRYGSELKPVVSCSFGVDSLVQLHLVKRVTDERGIPLDVVWNNTLNEYPQTRLFAKELTEKWGLNLIEARPDTTLRKIYDHYGVDSLLKPKGDRSNGRPVVENCCNSLKHLPMKRAARKNGWNLQFVGIRTGESRQRWKSARIHGEMFYSTSEWKMYTVRPILWWCSLSDSFSWGNNQQEDIWEYVRKYDLPYNGIYDLNAVLDDAWEGPRVVPRVEAQRLADEGYNVFMPRTGCQACPIPIKRGYLRYLREVFPKVYRAMLFQLGFARVLVMEMHADERRKLLDELNSFGVIDGKTEDALIEKLEEVLEFKPCVFDSVGVKK